jgi:hypothetical protein
MGKTAKYVDRLNQVSFVLNSEKEKNLVHAGASDPLVIFSILHPYD